MKLKPLIISLIALSILFLTIKYAWGFVPIDIPYDISPAQGQSSGCTPPIQFSIDNKCSISWKNKWSVNEFNCGDYLVIGDCEGGVINYHIDEEEKFIEAVLFAILFAILASISLIFVMSIYNS